MPLPLPMLGATERVSHGRAAAVDAEAGIPVRALMVGTEEAVLPVPGSSAAAPTAAPMAAAAGGGCTAAVGSVAALKGALIEEEAASTIELDEPATP